MRTLRNTILGLALAAAFVAGACGDDDGVTPTIDAPAGGGTPDAGVVVVDAATPDADCYTNPGTHEQIINACTDAVKIDKNPVLPHLLPDGGLPPIP